MNLSELVERKQGKDEENYVTSKEENCWVAQGSTIKAKVLKKRLVGTCINHIRELNLRYILFRDSMEEERGQKKSEQTQTSKYIRDHLPRILEVV